MATEVGPGLTLVAALGLAMHASPAFAGDAMRCSGKIIDVGDSIDKVLHYCGEPAQRSRTFILRRPRYELGSQEYSFPGEEEVPVDTWIYDFGPNRLVRKVRMIAGKVDSIDTLEYGTNR